jgi:hypothetical protein
MRELIEEVARIIEPRAWEKAAGTWRYRDALEVQAKALAKAEAILALSLLPDVEEGGRSSVARDALPDGRPEAQCKSEGEG